MSKAMPVLFAGRELPLEIEKVDRSRLYGSVDQEVLDEQGRFCHLVTLNGDGHTLAGKGETAMAVLSPDREWRDRSQLRAVDAEGRPIIPVPSSFAAPIPLEAKATIDDFLSHNIHMVYLLTSEETLDDLLAELRNGTIFRFPFSYRGGLEAQAGFILLGADGHPFLLVGTPTNHQFVGLRQAASPVEEAETEEDDDDGLDFSMM